MPLALVAAEEALRWDTLIGDRRTTLDKSDSIIATLLGARASEVTWVGPPELRHIARRAPGIAPDPDQMGTPFLRASNLIDRRAFRGADRFARRQDRVAHHRTGRGR